MKKNDLVITTPNFESLVASLRSNLKLNYGKCSEIAFVGGFFRAVLQQGKDEDYILRLGSVEAATKENALDTMDYLANTSTPAKEANRAYVEDVPVDDVKVLDTEVEAVKIKRTRRKTNKETK